MEENKNVEVTTETGSKFGWGVLGFFIPLVGLILFLVWLKTKPKSAKASGIGALIGFIVGLLLTVVSIVIFFTILGGEFGRLFGDYRMEYDPITVIDEIDDEIDDETENVCTGKFTHGSSSNEYILDLANDYVDCETVTYKLNDDFTIKAERKPNSTHTTIYINDNNELDKNGIMIHQQKLKVGIIGKTLITQVMHQTTTNGGYSIVAVDTDGNDYNFQANPEGRGRDVNLFSIDGMLDDDFTINSDGSLVITGTRASDICDNIMDDCIRPEDLCNSSYEDLVSKYGISDDYAYKADYTFETTSDGTFNFNYTKANTTMTWHEYYNKTCNR